MIKRNPCRVKKVQYKANGVETIEVRGYDQERKTLDDEEQI